jgi:hypothetical protein
MKLDTLDTRAFRDGKPHITISDKGVTLHADGYRRTVYFEALRDCPELREDFNEEIENHLNGSEL